MANKLGSRIEYNRHVTGIDITSHTVFVDDGEKYSADVIITTIPWI